MKKQNKSTRQWKKELFGIFVHASFHPPCFGIAALAQSESLRDFASLSTIVIIASGASRKYVDQPPNTAAPSRNNF
jgi:hypothetical protein